MSDNDESNLPPADECEKRCQEFASITGTDTALAMFYLQDRDWSLDVIYIIYLFFINFFSVRLLSVLRGHILILEKEPVFSLFNVEC